MARRRTRHKRERAEFKRNCVKRTIQSIVKLVIGGKDNLWFEHPMKPVGHRICDAPLNECVVSEITAHDDIGKRARRSELILYGIAECYPSLRYYAMGAVYALEHIADFEEWGPMGIHMNSEETKRWIAEMKERVVNGTDGELWFE